MKRVCSLRGRQEYNSPKLIQLFEVIGKSKPNKIVGVITGHLPLTFHIQKIGKVDSVDCDARTLHFRPVETA